jgi:uncharacterized protein YndB with AHSA1/START domain
MVSGRAEPCRVGKDLWVAATLSLHLERHFPASVAEVFAANTDQELLAQWWGPKGFSVLAVELDVEVGGHYRITMQPPEGDPFFLSGEYQAVDECSRLAYTFRWDPPDPDDRETVVVLSFRGRGGSTALVVDQGDFATEARKGLHVQGWTESIDRLEALLASKGRADSGSA